MLAYATMQEFEDFKVLRKLGQGATSDVYLAEDAKGKRRALKVFNQFLPADQGDLTFKRELENLGKLRNDKIVSVYDLKKDRQGRWILIQEFIDGPSLKDKLQEEMTPLERIVLALTITSEVLYALEESHAKGIIHRDIKPENILLDFKGRIVLSDFGLSKNLNLSQKSLHGNFFGSPQYMSLGQFSKGEAGKGVDIYAIGVLLYEVISGVVPYKGESIEDIVLAKKNGEFRPIENLNVYTPLKLARLTNDLLSSESKAAKNTEAYQLRFELLNILGDLGLGLQKCLKLICQKGQILSKSEENRLKILVLAELEESFDKNKDRDKKRITLNQILKIDSENKRSIQDKKIKKWFLLFPLIVGLSLAFLPALKETKEKDLPLTKNNKKEDRRIEEKPVTKAPPTRFRYGHLVINTPPDIIVFLDGKRFRKVNQKAFVKVGSYQITLKKKGYKTMSHQIEIEENKETIINLD